MPGKIELPVIINLRESEEPVIEEPKLEDASITAAFRIQETSPIIEFIEEKGKKKAIYRVIQAGWSGNGFYYSKDVTPQLVPFIENRPMFFADHIEPAQKKDMVFGQKLKEAVAVAEKVWATDDGQVLAKLAPVGNPATSWIWEAAQAHPEIIGNSIDAYGKVKKGEAEGRKGMIVESFVGYDSTDFVYKPAAGGKFMSVTEAKQVSNDVNFVQIEGQTPDLSGKTTTTEGDVTGNIPYVYPDYDLETGTIYPYSDSATIESTLSEDDYSLKEAAKTLKDVIDSRQKRSLFWNIGYILIDFLADISMDRNMSDDEKKKKIDTALKDFVGQIREIDPITLFNESLIEGEDIKPIDKLKNKLEDNMEKNELLEALKSYTPAQILESNPDLYNAIVKASVEDKDVQAALGKLPTLEKDNKELLEKVETLSTEKKKAEDDLKESNDKLQKYVEAEEKAEWAGKVDEYIKESKIDNALVTETFKGQLMESKDEEKVKTLLDDRKGLKTEADPNFDNGKPTKTTEQEKEATIPSNEQLAIDIKSR